MFFRQNNTQTFFPFPLSLRKELLLVVCIVFSLVSGLFESSSLSESQEKNIWTVKGPSKVRGASHKSAMLREHIREITIIPAKAEPPKPQAVQHSPEKKKEFGVATQIGENTWTMTVEDDATMATPSQIIQALNTYRAGKGIGQLSSDQRLSEYAQSRANFFAGNGGMDSHAGFQDFISHQDGFSKLGFFALGENSSYGYHLHATNLIEGVFAGDVPHDTNQLNPEWTHVGVGVSGVAVDIVFAGRKQ